MRESEIDVACPRTALAFRTVKRYIPKWRNRSNGGAMPNPRVLVFQHIGVCHPGILWEFLREDGIAWQTVRLDLGEPIPDLTEFDALWVMGGPQDVWQEAGHPW